MWSTRVSATYQTEPHEMDSLVSGAKFFKVKEAKGMKMKSVLLGISKTDIIKMDKKTNEILETWPLEDVKRWAGSSKSFALDFGDEKYTVRTPEGDGERMSRLVSKNKPATLPRAMSPPDPNSPMWKSSTLPPSNGSSPGWNTPLPTPMVPKNLIIDRSPRMVVEPSTVPAPATATIIEKKPEPTRKRPARDPSPEPDKQSSTESIDVYSPPKYETVQYETITHETVLNHEPPVKKVSITTNTNKKQEPKKIVKYDIQKTEGKAIINLPPPEKKKKKQETKYEYIVEQHTKEVHYGIEKISGKSIINLDALKPKKKAKRPKKKPDRSDPDDDIDEKRRQLRKNLEQPQVSRQVVNVPDDKDLNKDNLEPTFTAFFRHLGEGEPITPIEEENEIAEAPETELEPMEKEEPEDKVKERVEKEHVDPVNEEFFKTMNEVFLKSIEMPTIKRTMVPIVPTVEDEAVEEDIAVDDVTLNFCAFFRKYGDLEPAEVPEVELDEKEPTEMPELDVPELVVEDEIIPEKVVNEKKIEPEIVYPVYDEFFRSYPEMIPPKEEPEEKVGAPEETEGVAEEKEEPKPQLLLRRKQEEPEHVQTRRIYATPAPGADGEEASPAPEGLSSSSNITVTTMKSVHTNSLQGLDPRQRRVVVPNPPEDDPLTDAKLRLVKETREFHRSATKVVIITKTSTSKVTIVSASEKISEKIVSKLISAEHFSKAETLAESKEKVEVAGIEIKSLAKEVSARAKGVNNEVSELVVGYSEELEEMLEVAIEFCEMCTDKEQMEYVLKLVKEVCIAASTLLNNARKLIEEPDKPRHKIDLAMSAKGVTNNINDFLDAVLNWPIDKKYDGFDAQARTDLPQGIGRPDLMDTLGLKDKDRNNDTNLQRQLRDKAEDLENYWKDGDPNYKGYQYPTYKDEIYGGGSGNSGGNGSNNKDGIYGGGSGNSEKNDSTNKDGIYGGGSGNSGKNAYDSNNKPRGTVI
ncbi:titin-like isoform X1 [Branchiostoma floridae]|uniref:Titin-like isoform X1 n=1 Tax=Branchiostoma floridae TaxID=7739 RepID=A0A9J7LNF8_BRAFL|nr:titin-like isoform X1 [Branchiostoma floridae]